MNDPNLPSSATQQAQESTGATDTTNGNPTAPDAGNGQVSVLAKPILVRLLEIASANPKLAGTIRTIVAFASGGKAVSADSNYELAADLILTLAMFAWSRWEKNRHAEHVETMTTDLHRAEIKTVMAELKASTSPQQKGPTS